MKLPKLNPTLRIAIGLAALTTTIIFVASFLGLVPNLKPEKLESRHQLCKSIAIAFATRADQVETEKIRGFLEGVADQNPDVVSIGIRRADDTRLLELGDHFNHWSLSKTSKSTDTQVYIPVLDENGIWGTVEVRFEALSKSGVSGILSHPEILLSAFVGVCGLFVFYIYLRSVLQQLNPSKVIPQRVRLAFDALAEGVLVLDTKERIVLANKAFQDATHLSMDALMGRRASMLPFFTKSSMDPENTDSPWVKTLDSNESIRGHVMELKLGEDKPIFSVSCAPILDSKGENRGALASFENVTRIESQRAELEILVGSLTSATEEITLQNQELERLATIDPLTNCFNRRSFLDKFEAMWISANRHDKPLSAVMVDIDHFKSVNDTHGHAAGDEVLRDVAHALLTHTRESDVVCRFGGEEFAILLPEADLNFAEHVAEQLRLAISNLEFENLSVTASLGVSSRCQKPLSPQDLLEQADKSLYTAKRSGRDQVFRWDNVPEDVEVDESEISRVVPDGDVREIPFHAVTALIASLAFRDPQTASHCRRVADLCVAIGEDLLPLTSCYTLEVAGLLHDIGKIGLPDSILLKRDELTEDEWKVMRKHERFGAELIRTSFACPGLSEIIESFRIPFCESEKGTSDLAVSARILAIVDAYVSMTSGSTFRDAMTPAEAIDELTRCSGQQFDPELIEKSTEKLKSMSFELPQHRVSVSKAAALGIGLQIEKLSIALDKLDTDGIEAIALRLASTAEKGGASQIAEKAKLISKLNDEKTEDNENYDLIMSTIELLDLCRASQTALIQTSPTE